MDFIRLVDDAKRNIVEIFGEEVKEIFPCIGFVGFMLGQEPVHRESVGTWRPVGVCRIFQHGTYEVSIDMDSLEQNCYTEDYIVGIIAHEITHAIMDYWHVRHILYSQSALKRLTRFCMGSAYAEASYKAGEKEEVICDYILYRVWLRREEEYLPEMEGYIRWVQYCIKHPKKYL